MPNNEISHADCHPSSAATLHILRQRIARWTEQADFVRTPVSGVYLFRRNAPSGPETVMYEPSICILVQGAKRVYTGQGSLVYDRQQFLVASVDIPTIVDVVSATPEEPCLGMVIDIDQSEILRLMLHDELPPPATHQTSLGISTGLLTLPLLDAAHRLINLLDEPGDIPILAPIIRREIHYRLLRSEQGARLRQMATIGSRSYQIAQAIDWLKKNFAEPLRIDDLAAHVCMSASTFYQHFKAMTAQSPLQYQKWLRLNEARRLMLTERLDASHAALAVGYESPSHFNREYSRQFGTPPRRDIEHLRRQTP